MTVTSKVHDTILFEESVNIYITVVDPTLNICPEEWVLTSRVALPDSSTAVGSVQDTVTESELSSISEVTSEAGQFIIFGALLSSEIARQHNYKQTKCPSSTNCYIVGTTYCKQLTIGLVKHCPLKGLQLAKLEKSIPLMLLP